MALKHFRYYIYGNRFELFTDHQALTFLFTSKDPSYMLVNWMDQLMEYNFSITHRPGAEMVLPDALSRLYRNFTKGDELSSQHDNFSSCATLMIEPRKKGVCISCSKRISRSCPTGYCLEHCPGCKIHRSVSTTSSSSSLDSLELTSTIQLDSSNSNSVATEMDEFIQNVANKLDPGSDRNRMEQVLKAHEFNHAGADNLFKYLFSSGYYWKDMKKHCRVIAGNCRACLQFNITRRGFHPLRTIGATYPFDHISIDLGQISVTSQLGNNYFLVVIDICTRYILIRPIPSKSALVVARSLVKIYSDFGIPKILQSDNGTEFVNQIMDELKNNCGFEQRTISSYYPQSNGAAENAVKL